MQPEAVWDTTMPQLDLTQAHLQCWLEHQALYGIYVAYIVYVYTYAWLYCSSAGTCSICSTHPNSGNGDIELQDRQCSSYVLESIQCDMLRSLLKG